MVSLEQVFGPPAIVNGAAAVTQEICAAALPLLVSVTFLGLLIVVASTLPKFNNLAEAVSSVGVGGGGGVRDPVGEISKTVPSPQAPPYKVVPYSLPLVSMIRPASGLAPS